MVGYYLFSLFVFFLVLIILLVVKRMFKRNQDTFLIQEEKLLKIYSQIEDMMDGFDDYVEEVKREIKDSQDDIKVYLKKYKTDMNKTYSQEPKVVQPEVVQIKDDTQQGDEVSINEKVKKLYGEGVGINEIAKKFNITEAEINLIVNISKKN